MKPSASWAIASTDSWARPCSTLSCSKRSVRAGAAWLPLPARPASRQANSRHRARSREKLMAALLRSGRRGGAGVHGTGLDAVDLAFDRTNHFGQRFVDLLGLQRLGA